MGLLQRITHDLKTGWAGLRYGTAQAATRALVETELFRLRLEVRTFDHMIDDLCRDIGERAVELHERGERAEQVIADSKIVQAVEQVRVLQAERVKRLKEMDETKEGHDETPSR